MKPLRVTALCIVIVSFIIWFSVPFLTVATLWKETSLTAADLLSDNETDIQMYFWISLVSLLALVFSFINILFQKTGRGLMSSAGMGMSILVVGLLRAIAVDSLMEEMFGSLSSLAGEEHFDTGCYILLIAFVVLFALGSAINKEAEDEASAPAVTRKAPPKDKQPAVSTPTAKATSENSAQILKCCQCGKTAQRTEFYAVGVNGTADLGICHQCYDKFY